MDDKKQVLKQIGWSDELIEKCLSPNNKLALEVSHVEYHILVASEQDVTNFVVSADTSPISDGTHLFMPKAKNQDIKRKPPKDINQLAAFIVKTTTGEPPPKIRKAG
jgi:hypothetical protein